MGDGAGVGDGGGVGVGASVAEAGSVGGTSVGGGDGLPAAATVLGVAVPCTLIVVDDCRFSRKKITARTIMSTPSPSATHGQRLEGSSGYDEGGGATVPIKVHLRTLRALVVIPPALSCLPVTRRGAAQPTEVRIGEDGGRAALLVDGVVQSISPDDVLSQGGYWAAMLPDIRPRRALILGLGGGTLAQLLLARWGTERIVGVDDSDLVLDVARSVGWLPRNGLEVVIADAFGYVYVCEERFDYIAVDLFRGGYLPGRAFGKPFLRRLRTLLEPHGRLAVNVFSDLRIFTRLARISAFFDIREQRGVGGNVIIHARRRG